MLIENYFLRLAFGVARNYRFGVDQSEYGCCVNV